MDARGPAGLSAPRPRSRPGLEFAGVSGLAIAILAVVYRRPPTLSHVLPPCPFHQMTGLYCPGCGATRAMYDLMHGHPLAALAMNPLLVLSLPYFVYLYVKAAVRLTRRRIDTPLAGPRLQSVACRALWVLIPVWWALRNLPFPPFKYLAPH